MVNVQLMGIVNITEDSFYDGGLYLKTEDAVERCKTLVEQGAAIIDLGAASTHPDAQPVPPAEEIKRLAPVIHHIRDLGAKISIDTFHPEVQRFAISEEVDYLNDIQGFPDESLYEELAAAKCNLIVMHSVQRKGKATRVESDPQMLFDEILEFFYKRTEALMKAGVDRSRFILDPGMGFFLGSKPESSLVVLKRLNLLRTEFDLPVMVSVSHKSFLGMLSGREPKERGAATLAAELYATLNGAEYIRTHHVAPLHDAMKIWCAIDES